MSVNDPSAEASTVRPEYAAGVPGPRDAAEARAREEAAAAPPPEAAPAGEPLVLGLPAFIVGSVALALVDINFAPLAAVGAAIPIIVTATSVGLLIATIWAARLGQSAVAGVLGVFAGFWLSYAAVVIGLGHRWWTVLPAGVARTAEVFLIAWIVVMGLLTLGTLRLPLAYFALMVLVDAALVILLVATVQASPGLTKTGGWVIMAFAVLGAYLYASTLNVVTGGRPLPMGSPLLR